MQAHEIVTLEEAKAFLRVLADDEDELIEMLIGAATEAALRLADAHDPADEAPLTLKLAILVHVARAFDTRDDVDVPSSGARLLSPLRVRSVG